MALINEKRPSKKLDKKQATYSEKQKYRKIKEQIFEKEKTNNQHIYLYRSSKDWWKVGGNSALFYKYKIAPVLKIAVNLNKDNDHYSTFRYGIVSVRSVKDFEARMEKAGLKPGKGNDNAKDFIFEKKIDLSTIKTIKADIDFQHERMNRLVETRQVAPDMYVLIREFMEEFWHYSKKYGKKNVRGTAASETIKEMIKMKRDYAHIANGDLDIKVGMLNIKMRADALLSDISFLEEVQEMGFDKAVNLCTYLGDIKRLVNREMKKVLREEESGANTD